MTSSSIRVLLVEDSPSDAQLLEEHLSLVGFDQFEVTRVERLDAALQQMRSRPFDVILLDLSLPDSSGHDTFLRAQREAPHVPLVVLSGTSDELLAVDAVKHGIQDYLVKGQTNERQIARAIRYAIERKRTESALRESEERYRALADMLERKVEERTADMRRLNQTLEMMTRCNEAIVRAHREEDLFSDVCRIIIEVGGYRMAWVGLAQDDEAKTVFPMAYAGLETGYLSGVRISWADDEYGRNPTGTSIRTGEMVILRDLQSGPATTHWLEEARRSGFGACVALPLGGIGATHCSLTIYTCEPETFDDEETRVLQELAKDLAFGLTALRTRRDRNRVRLALERSNNQLRTLAAELTHAEERERRSLAQAIHDQLQQLLVGAKLCSDTLTRRASAKADEEVLHQLGEFLTEAIESARSLTFELSPPVLYDVGLGAALEWLGRWMKSKHGLVVEVRADREVEPGSDDVRVLLFQATRELLFNVVKHAQTGLAEVKLCRAGKDQIQITVSDKGIGFDPEKCMGDETSQTGFGLFSIRGRLDLIGGQIEITSSPGCGSRFTLLAPLDTAGSPVRPPAGAANKPASPTRGDSKRSVRSGKKIRVLLADDQVLVRQGLVRLLQERKEFAVVGEAGDGEEALRLAREVHPDLILMDVSMPRMNGLEATSRLRQELPYIKVIALSAWDEPEQGAAMAAAGAVACLSKAAPTKTLFDTIRGCLAPRRGHHQTRVR